MFECSKFALSCELGCFIRKPTFPASLVSLPFYFSVCRNMVWSCFGCIGSQQNKPEIRYILWYHRRKIHIILMCLTIDLTFFLLFPFLLVSETTRIIHGKSTLSRSCFKPQITSAKRTKLAREDLEVFIGVEQAKALR